MSEHWFDPSLRYDERNYFPYVFYSGATISQATVKWSRKKTITNAAFKCASYSQAYCLDLCSC